MAYAVREGARVGASLGNGGTSPTTVDPAIVAAVQRGLTDPIRMENITSIEIFKADTSGQPISRYMNTYDKDGEPGRHRGLAGLDAGDRGQRRLDRRPGALRLPSEHAAVPADGLVLGRPGPVQRAQDDRHVGHAPGADAVIAAAPRDRSAGRGKAGGQILVMFAGGMVLLIGVLAVVIDVGQPVERIHPRAAGRGGRGARRRPVHAGRLLDGLVARRRRGRQERLLDVDRRDRHAVPQHRVRPAPGRHGVDDLQHLLHGRHRHQDRAGHQDGDRGVLAAGPDGQPAQQLRRQLRQLLDRHRGPGVGPRQRRRVRGVLQPEPHPQHPVRRQRLPVRHRRPRRRGLDQHRPVRRRRSAPSTRPRGPATAGSSDPTFPSVSTYFTLWSDPAATPLDYTDDVAVAQTGTLFEHERQSDRSATYRDTSYTLPERDLVRPARLHQHDATTTSGGRWAR